MTKGFQIPWFDYLLRDTRFPGYPGYPGYPGLIMAKGYQIPWFGVIVTIQGIPVKTSRRESL
jgi:hypothetical protein